MSNMKDLKILTLIVSVYNQNSLFLGMHKEALFPFSQRVRFVPKINCIDKKLNDKARGFLFF